MGSRRRRRLSDSAICKLYVVDGEPRSMIALRAGLYDAEVLDVLRRNGVSIRSPAEVRALASAARRRHVGTLKLPG